MRLAPHKKTAGIMPGMILSGTTAAQRGSMAGKFELYKDVTGKFRFRLKAANGESIATAEAYASKASALGGIDSVRRNAGDLLG